MKIVIDIDEKTYNALTHTEFDASLVVDEMRKAIANGTPLPKGHGRLIDADAYVKEYGCFGYLEDIDIDCFNMFIPTIIEADNAERGENNQ